MLLPPQLHTTQTLLTNRSRSVPCRVQVCRVRCVWHLCWRGHVVGGARREQPRHCDVRLGQYHVLQRCASVGKGETLACTPWRQATPHKLLSTGPRNAQTVRLWCDVDESDAWGEAATSAVLTQYHSGLSAVLLWLSSTPAALPSRCGGAAPAARLSDLHVAFPSAVRTATRRSPCSPCSLPPG
jgi:hypothetical protein